MIDESGQSSGFGVVALETPMVTEKMIEAALDAALKADIIPMDDPKHDGVRINDYLQYTPADAVELGVHLTEKTSDGKPRWHGYSDIMGDEHEDTNRAILRPLIKAALEAALSTGAEPVGWFNPWNDYHGYQQVAKEYEGTPGKIPLYAAPPAPSVAVKGSLEAAATAVDKAWREKGGINCTEVCAVIRSALSAQVQDDSEIIDCLLEGKPFVFDPATNFCHADDGGAPEHGIKYVPAAQVQDVAIPEGWQLVPKKATREMCKDGERWTPMPEQVWEDMIGAAPISDLEAAPAAKLEEKP